MIVGLPLPLAAAIGLAWPGPNPVALSLNLGAAFVGALLLFGDVVMLRSSLVTKKRVRDRALREFVRVLKPGGSIAIFDILHTARYAELLRDAGLRVQDLGYDLAGFLRGHSLLAWKPESDAA